jgi:hypothetical protein
LPVWSALEGWAFNPTSFGDVRERIGKTSPVWKNPSLQRIKRQELLEQIEMSIDAAPS